MDSFIFALNAVSPIVLMVAIGYFLKRTGIVNGTVSKAVNKIVFKLLLPSTLFLNIYKIESLAHMDFGYIWFAVITVLIVFAVGIPLCCFITKQHDQRGPILQAIFRSNFALIGLPLATSLFGEEGAMVTTVLSTFAIPLFNILAVISLTVFFGDKVNVKKIVVGIAKNPLIHSVIIGGICLAIRVLFVSKGIEFRLTDIEPLYSVIDQFSKSATPIALLMLGAEFELSAVPVLKKQIIFGTAMRIFVVPSVALLSAYLLGCFSGAHFAAFVALFGSPVAISSVSMAQEMGSDSKLAGQLIVWTTVMSVFTIFFFSFILKEVGVF